MFTVGPRNDALETLELRDTEGKGLAVLAPARGGLLTRLALGGRHLFFLDEKTLRDTEKNVRGGNPVLFPQPGKLEGDAFARDGKSGTMKQHGFARLLPWEVASTHADGEGASATLRLVANDVTRAAYPWDFVAEYTYTLRPRALRIDMAFENTGKDPMPFGAGFHPYFHVKQSDKGATRIGTKATRAFDNVAKKELTLHGINLTREEVDLHLADHGDGPCSLVTPQGAIEIRASKETTRWVVWTQRGKDFVCVEPWTCPGNALNTGEGLLTLAPGERRTLFVEYALGA